MANKIYIHYGDTEYRPELVSIEHRAIRTKPDKGLWGSPVDSEWGWNDWCRAEDWSCCDMSVHFKFTLSDNAKILEVHSEDDILPYLIQDQDISYPVAKTDICDTLNREKVYSEFDGIELFLSENYSMHNGVFNSWDCDSVVVWNPDVIQQVKE